MAERNRAFTSTEHLRVIAEVLEKMRLGYIRTDPDGVKRNQEDDAEFLRRIKTFTLRRRRSANGEKR